MATLKQIVQIIRHRQVPVAINFSAVSLQKKCFQQQVLLILDQNRCIAPLLAVEVTETVRIEDFHSVNQFLSELKLMGIESVIDDFGAGFATHVYIDYLPAASTAKIDGKYIRKAHTKRGRATLQGMVRFLRSRLKKVVVEGVENPLQLQILLKMEIEFAQGYLHGKPGPF